MIHLCRIIRLLMLHDLFPNCGENVGGNGELRIGTRERGTYSSTAADHHTKKKETWEVVKAWRGSRATGILQSYNSSIVYSYYRAFMYAHENENSRKTKIQFAFLY